MAFEVWLTYAIAAGILLAIPGPTILLVVSYALTEGRRSAWATVVGVVLGDFTAMTLSVAGIGALLSTSAVLFTAMKWIGAGYLVYLGIKMWRSGTAPTEMPTGNSSHSAWSMMTHSFAVTALNPKGIVFFVAFLPQFITPARPVLPQMALLGGTFLLLAFFNTAAYALMAGSIRNLLRKPRVMRGVHRVGGGLLAGAGAMTAAMGRSS